MDRRFVQQQWYLGSTNASHSGRDRIGPILESWHDAIALVYGETVDNGDADEPPG